MRGMKSGPKPRPPLERLMARVTQHPDGGCWVSSMIERRYGYARVGLPDGRYLKGHRLTYEAFVGPIPDGLELDHLCRNRACVNPAHLEPVTHLENVRRGEKAQRTHCVHGHEFTPENTYVRKEGRRVCRECRNRRVAASHAKTRISACVDCGAVVTVGPRCHPCGARNFHQNWNGVRANTSPVNQSE